MKLLKIITAPDERLSKKAQNVRIFDQKLTDFAQNLIHTMQNHEGVGLASTQVEDELIFELPSISEYRPQPNIFIFQPEETVKIAVNPMILAYSKETNFAPEGCLSLPGEESYEDVERATKIKVQYQNLEGKIINETLINFSARVFQHEYDHTIGKIFPDRLDPSKNASFWLKYEKAKE